MCLSVKAELISYYNVHQLLKRHRNLQMNCQKNVESSFNTISLIHIPTCIDNQSFKVSYSCYNLFTYSQSCFTFTSPYYSFVDTDACVFHLDDAEGTKWDRYLQYVIFFSNGSIGILTAYHLAIIR